MLQDFDKALKAKPKAKAKAKAKARGAPKAKTVPPVKSQHLFLDHAKKKEFDKVMKLVKENPGYVNVQPAGRWTALHQAAEAGDKKVVKFLLEQKADVTLQTNDGQRPIDIAKASVKDLLKLPVKRKAAAIDTSKGPRLHLFEPMSAIELAETQGGWMAGDEEVFCEEGVQHLDMKTAPAEAKALAQELHKAVKGAVLPAGESDVEAMVVVISNAGDCTASEAILQALAVLEEADGEDLHAQAAAEEVDFNDKEEFCKDHPDEDEEEEEEDEHSEKIKRIKKLKAFQLLEMKKMHASALRDSIADSVGDVPSSSAQHWKKKKRHPVQLLEPAPLLEHLQACAVMKFEVFDFIQNQDKPGEIQLFPDLK
ncbi:TNKS2 [Symbiodinium natans]|uniref:TNKS2 protein n=1 Tax=Symbiodinium natans TaxID=878477 RepID=A0A812QSW2_9DINO|nr:TNKS2 [Symbiodinium natans]